jgi:steroid delta-isomerase-like uncharacterized protein
MSIRDVALRFYDEIFNEDRPGALEELVAPDAVMHGAGISELPASGPSELRAQVDVLRDAFPDLHIRVDDIVCEGDLAALRCTATGTHRGVALGVPPTGRRVTIQGVSFCRIRGGQLVESWNHFDLLSLYRQLGLLRLLAGDGPLPPEGGRS